MKTTPALLATLLLASGPVLAPAAFAQNSATQTTAPSASEHATAKPDMYHAKLEERINSMHQRLQITPEQETIWNGFAGTMRSNAEAIQQVYKQRAEKLNTMTAPENLHDYAQIEMDRAQNIQKLSAAFDALYAQLSEPQKKTADTMFRRYYVNRAQARHHGPATAK